MNVTQDTLLDAIGALDGDLIDGYFITRQRLIRKKSARRVAPRRIIAAIAACLAVVMLASYGLSYVPVEYQYHTVNAGSQNERTIKPKSVWIYYVNDLNFIVRERVKLKATIEGRFLAWRHLNGAENVVLLSHETIKTEESKFILNIVISNDINRYSNGDKLLKSLYKTMLECREECYITIK